MPKHLGFKFVVVEGARAAMAMNTGRLTLAITPDLGWFSLPRIVDLKQPAS